MVGAIYWYLFQLMSLSGESSYLFDVAPLKAEIFLLFLSAVLWKPWPVGGPGRIAPLEGFQDL